MTPPATMHVRSSESGDAISVITHMVGPTIRDYVSSGGAPSGAE